MSKAGKLMRKAIGAMKIDERDALLLIKYLDAIEVEHDAEMKRLKRNRGASLRTKLLTLRPREEMVLFGATDYKQLMRTTGSAQTRYPEVRDITYKKANVIVDDELKTGVIFRKEEE